MLNAIVSVGIWIIDLGHPIFAFSLLHKININAADDSVLFLVTIDDSIFYYVQESECKSFRKKGGSHHIIPEQCDSKLRIL